jgi:hypothetical protein
MSREQAFPTTVALFAIDISIPDVSAFRYLQSWGYRKPPICWSRKIARHTPTCICHSVLYSFSFLIPVSSSLRIPTYKRTIRAYCRTYTLPTRRNRAWLTFSFVHQYIFKQSLPEKITREVGKTTYTPQTWNYILFSVHNRHRSHCFGSIMKDWYCCTLL